MRKTSLLLLFIGALLGSCSLPREEPEPPVQPLPYHFRLELTSRIADPYYVLAGGSESYGRFPFNAWTRGALEKHLAARSGAGPTVVVAIELRELTTAYDEIGLGPYPSAPLYNGIGPLLLAGDELDRDGGTIPSELHKSATLKAGLALQRDKRTVASRELVEEVEIVVYWQDFDAWSYDYGEVLRAVIDKLVRDVDGELVRHFGAEP